MRSDNLSNLAFCSVAENGIADRPSGGNAEPRERQLARLNNQHNKRVGIRLPKTPHPLKIGCTGQTELSFHSLAREGALCQPKFESAVPIGFLDVIIHCHRQAQSAFLPASFENSAATAG